MIISFITLFPQMFEGPFSHSIIKNAVKKGLIELNFVNLRDFGIGKHKLVDDRPYGGGKGMVLRVDVLNDAIEFTKKTYGKPKEKQKVVLLDPTGTIYSQRKAKEFSKIDHLILVCGHYEGFDARVKTFVDEEISIGDFVLTGGELPAMIIADSVARLKDGVIAENAAENESFSNPENILLLEYPQYTRPEEFKDLKVPAILLSGNHEEINLWRKKQSLMLTKKNRPDLIKTKKQTKTPSVPH